MDDLNSAGDDQATRSSSDTRSTVIRLLEDLDQPTEETIHSAAAEAGHSLSRVEAVLLKLRRNGEIVETDGQLRLL
ncbi:MAG: hypothetical protein U5K37_11310 [Natrialbaceae archaeon]|nr:hypothetical protein [Natrialbaceae archaeon]